MATIPADPIHDSLRKLGEAVAEFARSWNDESLIVRSEARRAIRDAAMALVLACSDDADGELQ